MIRLEEVSKSYDGGATMAVDAISLSVEQGELMVLLGGSGCGKTTTLKMINRLIEPTSGRILVDDDDTAAVDPVALRRRIGYVFQGVGLFPHMTVGDNVAVTPRLLDWSESDVESRVDELLDLVGLPPDDFRDRYPAALSGGQRQRIGFARALAARPRLMLMDEPLGALDPITRDELQGEFRKIHEDLGLTTIMVTHDMTEALILGDRIAAMNLGNIAQVGTPHDLLNDPADAYVQRLMQTPRSQADRLEELLDQPAAEGGAGR